MGKGMDLHSRCRSELPHEQLVEIFSRLQVLDYKGIRIRTVEHSGQKWIRSFSRSNSAWRVRITLEKLGF